MAGSASRRRPRWRDPLYLVRWVFPSAVVLAGFGVLVVRRDTVGLEAFAMFAGAGLSIWLLNFLFRLSVSGNRDREEEDRARVFFEEHGHWPDESPPAHGHWPDEPPPARGYRPDEPPPAREVPAHRGSPAHERSRARRPAPRRRG